MCYIWISFYILFNIAGSWPLGALRILIIKTCLVPPGDGALDDIQQTAHVIFVTKISNGN